MAFNWRNHDDETIEYHFNPRLTIPDAMDLLQAMPDIAASARMSLDGSIDILDVVIAVYFVLFQ